MKIKVCGITMKEDFAALEQLGADFAGFIFYDQSRRFVGEQPDTLFKSIALSRIKKTGVFVDAALKEVLSKAERFRFDYVQLHGSETPAYCAELRKKVPVIRAFNIDAGFAFPSLYDYKDTCNYFLFDAKGKLPGGNSVTFTWSLLEAYQLTTPFFLSGGIAPQHLMDVLAFSHPAFYGIDVNSGFEISPGIKNIPALETFIHQLKRAA